MLLTQNHFSNKSYFSRTNEKLPVIIEKPHLDLNANENSELFENLLDIISRNPAARSKNDESVICKALQSIKVFLEVKKDEVDYDNFLIQTFDLMEHESFNEGEAVFHFGDRGDKFYIILKGSIEVYLPKSREELLQENYTERMGSKTNQMIFNPNSFLEEKNANKVQNERRGSKDLNFLLGSSSFVDEKMGNKLQNERRPSFVDDKVGNRFKSEQRVSKDIMNLINFDNQSTLGEHSSDNHETTKKKNNVENLKVKGSSHNPNITTPGQSLSNFVDKAELYFENGACKFRKMRKMGPGTYFGELALSSNLSRSATIIASDELHVASLTKAAYKQVCKNVERSLKIKWRFFSELLSGTTKETITKFCYSFKERNFKYNQKVIEEGEIPQEVFVIREGEVQVIVKQELEEGEGNGLKYFKRPKKIYEKKIANLGPFTFFGEGEALTQNPYEYSAISMTSSTVLYSTTIKDFQILSLDHAEAFQNILSKHKVKMDHWLVRSSSNFNFKGQEIFDTSEFNKTNTINHNKTRYLNFHTPRSLEQKLKIPSIETSVDKFQSLGMNFSSAIANESALNTTGTSPDRQTFYENINKSDENKDKIDNIKIYETIPSDILNTQSQFERLFSDDKEDNYKEKAEKSGLKDKRRLKKPAKLNNISVITSDGGDPLSPGIKELVKKGLFTNPEKKKHDIDYQSKEIAPYQIDVEKLKTKTHGYGLEKSNSPSRRDLVRGESDGTVLIGRSFSERPNLTLSKVHSDPALPKIDKKYENMIQPRGPQEINSSKIDMKKVGREDAANLEYFSSQRDDFSEISFDSIPARPTQYKHRKFKQPREPIASINTKKFHKKEKNALQLNTFPLLDFGFSSPKEGKIESFTQNSPQQNEFDLLKSPSELFLPILKDTKKAMIPSKHNMFRRKPQKTFLEYSCYEPSRLRDPIGNRSKK